MNYHDLLADIGIRINAIAGSQAATLETNFSVRPLTTAQWKSAVFSFTATKQTLQRAEERLATAIAETGNHPWRNFLASTTATLANEAQLPSQDANSKQIVGLWGSVYDASDSGVCVERPIEEISRRVSNANSRFKCPAYNFRIDGQRIYHTRAGVRIDVCIYDSAAQKTAIDSNAAILLPDVLAPAYVCGTLALLFRDTQFQSQAAQYAEMFAEQEKTIRQGLMSVEPKVRMAA